MAQTMAILVAMVASVWDLRVRRIPNVLTFGAAAAGLLYHVVTGGVDAGFMSLVGLLVGAVPLFVQFALGGIGAGDVKLMGALGAWLGPLDAIWLVLYTGIAGGVMALFVAGAHGYLRQACRNMVSLLLFWQIAGPRPMPELTLVTSQGPRLAYALPILAGTVVTWWVR